MSTTVAFAKNLQHLLTLLATLADGFNGHGRIALNDEKALIFRDDHFELRSTNEVVDGDARDLAFRELVTLVTTQLFVSGGKRQVQGPPYPAQSIGFSVGRSGKRRNPCRRVKQPRTPEAPLPGCIVARLSRAEALSHFDAAPQLPPPAPPAAPQPAEEVVEPAGAPEEVTEVVAPVADARDGVAADPTVEEQSDDMPPAGGEDEGDPFGGGGDVAFVLNGEDEVEDEVEVEDDPVLATEGEQVVKRDAPLDNGEVHYPASKRQRRVGPSPGETQASAAASQDARNVDEAVPPADPPAILVGGEEDAADY
ncbi:hypothetical protein THAOC_04417, partial [Thalassiosira oceanica]